MEGKRRFFHFSRTINEEHIINLLEAQGNLVFHTTEFDLAPKISKWDGECYFADILALFNRNHRDYLVGIEIKDWKKRVHPKLCLKYLYTYRQACEYFYIAARKFSVDALAIPELGLINLDTMMVVKQPSYLHPNEKQRAGVIRSLKKWSTLPCHIIEDQYQMKLEAFA